MAAGDPFLSHEEGGQLLRIARAALQSHLECKSFSAGAYPLTGKLLEKHAAFVTLWQRGVVRGCSGHLLECRPLAEMICESARNAATRDPRFAPIQTEELDGIQMEITVLCPGTSPGTPFIPVESMEDIRPGQDGLYLEGLGPHGGALLLPREAIAEGGTREQCVKALLRKAETSEDLWANPKARLYRFGVQTFRE